MQLLASARPRRPAASQEPPPAAPYLSSLDPASAERAAPGFALTLTGTGFSSGAQVLWNQTPLPTTLSATGPSFELVHGGGGRTSGCGPFV
jgi:hypothetical protein